MPKGNQNPSSKGGGEGVSNVRRMSKSSEIDGGGTAAATNASLEVVLVEEEGGAVPDGSTRGHLELSLK